MIDRLELIKRICEKLKREKEEAQELDFEEKG